MELAKEICRYLEEFYSKRRFIFNEDQVKVIKEGFIKFRDECMEINEESEGSEEWEEYTPEQILFKFRDMEIYSLELENLDDYISYRDHAYRELQGYFGDYEIGKEWNYFDDLCDKIMEEFDEQIEKIIGEKN